NVPDQVEFHGFKAFENGFCPLYPTPTQLLSGAGLHFCPRESGSSVLSVFYFFLPSILISNPRYLTSASLEFPQK
ncbi:MAG TPA: hypothetical protein VKA08_06120, partial [Balneolales bacterium]|nr:hypothetical protein [Balneolales bacterium]